MISEAKFWVGRAHKTPQCRPDHQTWTNVSDIHTQPFWHEFMSVTDEQTDRQTEFP